MVNHKGCPNLYQFALFGLALILEESLYLARRKTAYQRSMARATSATDVRRYGALCDALRLQPGGAAASHGNFNTIGDRDSAANRNPHAVAHSNRHRDFYGDEYADGDGYGD